MPEKFDSQKRHRRSIRLKGYDYSQPGAYFVTIVSYQRECLFGEIVDGQIPQQDADSLNRGGIPSQPGGEPPDQGEMTLPLRTPTLGQVVAYFKYQSTKEMNSLDGTGTITKFWQRNYYERIIRDEREMTKIWDYIETNPLNWVDDDENPLNIQP